MEKLSSLTFKAKLWHNSKVEVQGTIVLLDHSSLQLADPGVNRNGYLLCITDSLGHRHLVDPETVELIDELSNDLKMCEGCSGRWNYEDMRSDSDGVPLCENCFNSLQKESESWKCKVCDRKFKDFTGDECWAEDNLCNTCYEARI